MKKIVWIIFSIVFTSVFCYNKPGINFITCAFPVNVSILITNSLTQNPAEAENVLYPPYPASSQGIWVNMLYVKNLHTYNSVGKCLEFIKFDTDIKIGKDTVLVMRPQDSGMQALDNRKYYVLPVKNDTLYVVSKVTGEKEAYKKIKNLPDEDIFGLSDKRYSAISQTHWEWFKGEYECILPAEADTSMVCFSENGEIRGLDFRQYDFGIDVDGKDYLLLGDEDGEHEYLLIEYQPDGSFICYTIEHFEDWEEGFTQKEEKYRLRKIK